MNNNSYILRAFTETPWAILPNNLIVLEEIVMRHVAGEKLSAEEIQARTQGAVSAPQQRQIKSVAVLPLFGTIFPRANMLTDVSQSGTSADRFGQEFMQLVNDPSIDAIVLDVNSPGGQVGGIQEVSNMIFEAHSKKPIVAVASPMMASAAYWIGSAAGELVVTPSGVVGSIGVFAVHEDISAALEQDGIKTSIISAGKYKVEGNNLQPLTEEARASIQQSVNDVYDTFVGAVARNRGVDAEIVRNGFGEGRVVNANQAVELGMADSIGTLDETINRLLNTGPNQYSARGQASAAENFHTQEARARLAQVEKQYPEGDTPMYRELLKQRATLVARAENLVATADKEGRDLTEDERKEFAQLLGEGESTGEVGALDVQIARIQDERERLRVATEKKFIVGDTEKPGDSKKANSMKRADFDKLNPAQQAALMTSGIKLED